MVITLQYAPRTFHAIRAQKVTPRANGIAFELVLVQIWPKSEVLYMHATLIYRRNWFTAR